MQGNYQPKFEWRFLGPDFWLVWLLVGLLWLLMLVPGMVRQRIAKWLARYVLIRHRKRRRIVETNLALCFPDKPERARKIMARRFYEYTAMALLDYGLLWFGSSRRLNRRVVIKGVEHIENPYLSDRRIILLSCHSPAFEFGAMEITRRYPTVGLVRPVRNPLIEWLLSRARTRFNCRLIGRSEGLRHVVRAIRRKNLFYYLADEAPGSNQAARSLPLFGVERATQTVLGRMADLTHAVVVPCVTHFNRREDQYEVICFPALQGFPSGDEELDSRRMNETIEKLIRQAPEQYMWSYRMFQTPPEGEPSYYER